MRYLRSVVIMLTETRIISGMVMGGGADSVVMQVDQVEVEVVDRRGGG